MSKKDLLKKENEVRKRTIEEIQDKQKENIVSCINALKKNILPELNVGEEITLTYPLAIYLLDEILLFNPSVELLQTLWCGQKKQMKYIFFTEIKEDIKDVLKTLNESELLCSSNIESELRKIKENLIVVSEMQVRGHFLTPIEKNLKIKKAL